MHKTRGKLCAAVFICSFVLSLSAFAVAPRASDQIMTYNMDASAIGNGQIAIDFSVYGSGKMAEIGAESIYVYEKIGSQWLSVAYYDADDPGMSATNTYTYGNTIYYSGTAGTQYKVEVTIFAENSAGSDSRYKELYVTAN